MLMATRRDSFCGKMSACNNLWQYGIKYYADRAAHRGARLRTLSRPTSQSFAATCRIVKA